MNEKEINDYLDAEEKKTENKQPATQVQILAEAKKSENKREKQLVKKQTIPKDLVGMLHSETFLNRVRDQLGKRTEQFTTSVLTLYNSNKDFKDCDPKELFNVCLKSAAMDLPFESNLGQAYIIPYKDTHRKTEKYPQGGAPVPQLQIGWKGFVELAQRTNQYKLINVTEVREGEIGKRDRLSGEIEWNWIDDDTERLKHKIVGYVAYIKLLNGFEKTLYMSEEEVTEHGKKYSPQYRLYKKGMWVDQHEDMAKKTVIKLLLSKWGPKSTQMRQAIELDQSNGDGYYPDNNGLPVFDIQEAELGDNEN